MTKEFVYTGKAWKCPDNVLIYSILPSKYLFKDLSAGIDELKKHVMEGVDPDFSRAALEGKYRIIVAGKNFCGGGKSLEQPVYAIKGVGIDVVIAESFDRYFFRNAINNGLPLLSCKGITGFVETGDELTVHLDTGEVKNFTQNKTIKASPLPSFILDLVREGGYVQYIQKRMKKEVQEI